MRRGLTMVELLLALSLLSAILLATASWTQVAARTTADSIYPVRWRAAAQAVLQLIHDDLVTGDFTDTQRGRRNQNARVAVVNGALRIRTRAIGHTGDVTGLAIHRYAFDAYSGQLRLDQQTVTGTRYTRPLLDQVQEWQCVIDEEQNLLTVTITSSEESVIARSYLLP
ncbi:MAG: prepilin-type N-terminal cleavage/methylation domain-containing protein [Planctomycetes bacterium]|nr:prepilin-type N-terminal cleavage/methylation domain-containing protein [Planctomycetota bacterium]